MVEGYDGKELIKIFENYLPKGSTVLEIGMGPNRFELKKEEKECDYSQEQSQPFSLSQEQLHVQVHLHSLVILSPPIILS